MDPREEAPGAVFPQPGDGLIGDHAGRAFVARAPVGAARDEIAVRVESLGEAEPMVEGERAHESPGGKSVRAQDGGQGGTARIRIPLLRAPWPGG